ncbi:hypothetical protein SAMD00019534_083420 [Acytostelium subglobosum LB1]|uniref:hypothetical protein n=1 Tax=Acytostelium subglobosum LB1 TaxID=1410327 RepID=UPI00064508A4|nr:hypothetical protein SAMD00019534_083420 [Acytostelium subglobosum LB1]GAM25167.1 hypothetical protein SAMD00019534_083420 [Acytostelium subglobosum LB1]|eukprot:XP_012751687.1 hypothetical protein SAMD00019534_083420 [Acytostelium subglobosum LB1]
MPRAGFVGDELGSSIIGSRLVRDIMNLCFLMEKRYAPYPKWFGTAYKRLSCAAEFELCLKQAATAQTWQERELALSTAYELLAKKHNRLGLTKLLPEHVSSFHDRPFKVIHGELFANALAELINKDVFGDVIDTIRLIGNIDQISDNTDMRGNIILAKKKLM